MIDRSAELARENSYSRARKSMADGMNLMRFVDYSTISTLCEALCDLQTEYPTLEVRSVDADKDVALQVVKPKTIRYYKKQFSAVKTSEVTSALLKRVPSLAENQEIETTWVDSQLDSEGQGTFIMIVPGSMDVLKLCRERYQSHRTIERVAGSGRLAWPQPTPDLTAAYVPASEPSVAVNDTIVVVEAHLPLPVTLLPAL